MKLTELNPRWVLISRWDTPDGVQHYTNGDSSQRHGGGISFDCPVHTAICPACGQHTPASHRLVVWFANPIDGLPPQAAVEYLWQRTGETFLALTLAPSINAQGWHPGCWHGHIQNGDVL